MSEIDYLGLDGNTLRTLLAVLEESSVSKAAARLHVSQSAVSHTLDKLRQIFDDPLFVREGRGIVATAKASSLREPLEIILGNLKALTYAREFDPRTDPLEFIIATNDFPLQFIFPRLLRGLHAEGIDPRFRFIPSGVPSANLSRASRCQFLITPAPPTGKGIIKQPLFESKMMCFYDAAVRKPPGTWQQFVDSQYAEVRFSDTESSMMVLPSIDTSALNEPAVTVPNFAALAAFIKGTELITTQLGMMQKGLLHELDSSPLPLKTDSLTLYLVWHQRDHDDPAHQWFRERIIATVDSILEAEH